MMTSCILKYNTVWFDWCDWNKLEKYEKKLTDIIPLTS